MKWIVKASDEGVSCCSCAEALARLPGADQLDCPWCGCGWLFSCASCGLAFTYGRIAEVETWPTQIAHDMLTLNDDGTHAEVIPTRNLGRLPALRDAIANQSSLLGAVGSDVVIIDGRVLPLDYEMRSAGFVGRRGVHRLSRLPQFVTRDHHALVEAFAKPYWDSLDNRLFASS